MQGGKASVLDEVIEGLAVVAAVTVAAGAMSHASKPDRESRESSGGVTAVAEEVLSSVGKAIVGVVSAPLAALESSTSSAHVSPSRESSEIKVASAAVAGVVVAAVATGALLSEAKAGSKYDPESEPEPEREQVSVVEQAAVVGDASSVAKVLVGEVAAPQVTSESLHVLHEEVSQWEVLVDESSGKEYYYNAASDETSWAEPRCFAEYESAYDAYLSQPAVEAGASSVATAPVEGARDHREIADSTSAMPAVLVAGVATIQQSESPAANVEVVESLSSTQSQTSSPSPSPSSSSSSSTSSSSSSHAQHCT